MGALLDLAARYPDAVIPGYTHMRRAQAVLWPHYLLAYFEMFARDWERFGEARAARQPAAARLRRAGRQRLPLRPRGHRRATSASTASPRNSMDVSADRDFALDFLYAASVTMLHLSRLAEDWILYSSEEFGWLELGDGVTSGSSLMPQKKNPDSLELIRGKCGRVFGACTSLFVTMKGLPLTYNRDMQEDKEPLFDAADQLAGSLEMAARGGRDRRGSIPPRRWPPPKKAGWWPRTWPRRWRAPARRSTRRTRSSAAWCWKACAAASKPADWTAEELAAFAPEFTPEMARLLDPKEGMKTARSARRHRPPRRGARRSNEAARDAWRHARMNKSYRQGQILKLIRSKPIHTQEELAQELKNLGIDATQVTLSRDIRELRPGEDRRRATARWRPRTAGPQLRHAGLRVPAWTCARAEPGGAQDLAGPRQLRGRGARPARSGRKWWAPSPATTPSW